jgi:hypothetical protein
MEITMFIATSATRCENSLMQREKRKRVIPADTIIAAVWWCTSRPGENAMHMHARPRGLQSEM